MMLTTNRKPRPAGDRASTPYRDLLCGLAAVGDHDADAHHFLMGMVQCIDDDNYGTLRLLHRLLPLRDRRALGVPPATRGEDEPLIVSASFLNRRNVP